MTERHIANTYELTSSLVSMNLSGRFKPAESPLINAAILKTLLRDTGAQIFFGQQSSVTTSGLPDFFHLTGSGLAFIAYDTRLFTPCESGTDYRRRISDLL